MLEMPKSFSPKYKGGRASLWASMVSCLACLAVLGALIAADLFAAEHEEGPDIPAGKPVSAKVVTSDSGSPKLTITTNNGESQNSFDVLPDAVVELNGELVEVGDIHSGDVVTITIDDHKKIKTVSAERVHGGVVFSAGSRRIEVTTDFTDKTSYDLSPDAKILLNGETAKLEQLTRGDMVRLIVDSNGQAARVEIKRVSLLTQTWDNFRKNLFKPLLLFFYMGFSVPLLKVAFEFPHVIYQGLTIYLLVSIGWKGGRRTGPIFPA